MAMGPFPRRALIILARGENRRLYPTIKRGRAKEDRAEEERASEDRAAELRSLGASEGETKEERASEGGDSEPQRVE
jgi:hypothetical protein